MLTVTTEFSERREVAYSTTFFVGQFSRKNITNENVSLYRINYYIHKPFINIVPAERIPNGSRIKKNTRFIHTYKTGRFIYEYTARAN